MSIFANGPRMDEITDGPMSIIVHTPEVDLSRPVDIFAGHVIWFGAQHFEQVCMFAQLRLKSACACVCSLHMVFYGQPRSHSVFRSTAQTLICMCRLIRVFAGHTSSLVGNVDITYLKWCNPRHYIFRQNNIFHMSSYYAVSCPYILLMSSLTDFFYQSHVGQKLSTVRPPNISAN